MTVIRSVLRWNGASQIEPARFEELLELRQRAFPPVGQCQHVPIHANGGGQIPCPLGQHGLHYQEQAIGGHRLPARSQDLDRLGVVSVVNDTRQQIQIVASWDSADEVAGRELTPRGDRRR